MKKIILNIIIVSTLLIFITGCAVPSNVSKGTDGIETDLLEIFENREGDLPEANINEEEPITGEENPESPIDIDIETYRLKISGAVYKELSLSFDDVKKMDSTREEIELVCPGFFTEKGFWTGVKLIELLKLAGIKEEAKNIKFISIGDNYSQTLPIEVIEDDKFLVVYQYNDKELSKNQGYPLRLAVKDKAGSFWIRWLGEIQLLQ